jgi:dUTP pyrophosphatase
MKVNIKLIDASLPLPAYQTDGAVAIDLYSRINMKIAPKSLGFVPLNIIVKVPKDHALLVVPRSSTPKKKSLLIPHGIGIIDNDYHGEHDEVNFQCYNFGNTSVKIERGERIAQGIFVKVGMAKIEKVKKATGKSRGGFGSTG